MKVNAKLKLKIILLSIKSDLTVWIKKVSFREIETEKIIINITILELAVNEDLSSINPTKLLKRSQKIKKTN